MNKPALLITVYFSALMMFSIPAAHATGSASQPGVIDANIKQALSAGTSEEKLLRELISPKYGLSLQAATDAILAAGGSLVPVLHAALVINPKFEYIPATDPTAALSATSSGSNAGTTSSPAAPISRSFRPVGGGGHALDGG